MSVFCPKNCKKCRLGVDNGPGLRYNNRRRREQHPGTPHGVCGRSSSGRAPPCQGGGSEFEPRRPLHLCGSLAQLGEHLPYKQRVSGSSPIRVASSEILLFIGNPCKQGLRDERQISSSSPQIFAAQTFAGAPIHESSGGCRDKCTGYASVAQSVEQGTENPRVIGSIPIGGTTSKILSFIGKSCKQDFCDEYQIFSFSPQTFALQIFAGAPITQKNVISMRP